MAEPKRLLILASRQDRQAMDGVLRHLDLAVRQGQITLLWSEREPPGSDLTDWTTEALQSADAVLLGLSAELLADPSFMDMTLPRLVERQRRDGLRLLPLPLRPCLWRSVAELAPLRSLLPEGESLGSTPSSRRGQAELACAQALLALLVEGPSPREPRTPVPRDRSPRRTAGAPPPAPRWPWFAALLVLFAGLIGATLAFGPRLLREQQALLTTSALLTIALAAALLLTGALRATGRIAVSNQGFLSGAAAICLILFVTLKNAVLALTPPPGEWLLRGRIAGLPAGREAWLSASGCAEVSVDRQSERFTLPVHGPCDQPELTLQVRVTGHAPQTFKLPRPAPSADSVLSWRSAAPRVSTVAATLTVDRRPLPRAPVRLMAECPEAATLAPVESGTDGRFLFANLPPACTAPPLQVQITLPDGRLHLQKLQTALSDVIELPKVAPPTGAGSKPRAPAAERSTVVAEDADHLLVKGLPAGHGLDRGHWLGLFRPGPGGDPKLVGYGGVIEVTATTARVAVYHLRGARTGLSAGRLPPQPKVDKALGVVLEALEEGRARINLGRADGVAPGDRYRVLGAVVSDHTMAGRSLGRQEVGALEVEQVDHLFATAKVVKGSAERLSFIALER